MQTPLSRRRQAGQRVTVRERLVRVLRHRFNDADRPFLADSPTIRDYLLPSVPHLRDVIDTLTDTLSDCGKSIAAALAKRLKLPSPPELACE
jgi:hypothetical protein